ncbi:hypothetical protein [Geobacter sp. SVR]|uniref:hypothetical protein n=1 Tax=Geobacter sp. SVR TaxID=2495594 RepID=UPI00143EF9DC|nr:hypothetical protein [Geobacter sp. SVR]BCS54577.1 hypothetical protein GSVR_28850 [Geobacter sp. SVR]GCF86916.1 hypothetical protein GSbR_35160 [Geobacter sp. SVR]
MEQQLTEPVDLERMKRDAICIIIRVGLGEYRLTGPQDNIMTPESRVAWATVVHELQGEGYALVSPEEYAEETGLAPDAVTALIHEQGSLFALAYRDELVVPLPRKEAVLPVIEV